MSQLKAVFAGTGSCKVVALCNTRDRWHNYKSDEVGTRPTCNRQTLPADAVWVGMLWFMPLLEGTVQALSLTRTVPSPRNNGRLRQAEHSSFLIPVTEMLYTTVHKNCAVRLLAVTLTFWLTEFVKVKHKTNCILPTYFPFKISLCWGKAIYHHDHQIKGLYSEKLHLAFCAFDSFFAFGSFFALVQNCCYDHVGCFWKNHMEGTY